MIYKSTSCKEVIARVFSNLNLQEEQHRIMDMVSWCSEALLKIDAYPYYTIKITGKEDIDLIQISDYQAELPDDLHSIIGVKYSKTNLGPFIPMRYGTGNFGSRGTEKTVTSTEITADTEVVRAAMDLFELTYDQALSMINSDLDLKGKIAMMLKVQSNTSLTRNKDDASALDYVYYTNGNYIKFNVKEGYIMMAYKAVPIDDEGYPLVPEDESFQEALYWYIVNKLYYPDWLGGRIRDAVYYDARSNWNFYCKQAYGKSMMPSGDKLESLKNQWLTLYPEINSFDSEFSNLGNRQVIYNK
jgi:hypothetical protein